MGIIAEKIGFSVCHQLPDRCLHFGQTIISVCARCNGIYLGFFAAALFMFLMYRKRESGLPPLWVMVILLVLMASTIVDGLLSYLGATATNNNIRFITGFLCGSGIAAIIYPVFVFQYYDSSDDVPVLPGIKHFAFFLASAAAVISLVLARFAFLGGFFYYLTAASIIFTFYFVNLAALLLLPPFAQKARRLFSRHIILPSLLAMILAAAELYFFYAIQLAAIKAIS